MVNKRVFVIFYFINGNRVGLRDISFFYLLVDIYWVRIRYILGRFYLDICVWFFIYEILNIGSRLRDKSNLGGEFKILIGGIRDRGW